MPTDKILIQFSSDLQGEQLQAAVMKIRIKIARTFPAQGEKGYNSNSFKFYKQNSISTDPLNVHWYHASVPRADVEATIQSLKSPHIEAHRLYYKFSFQAVLDPHLNTMGQKVAVEEKVKTILGVFDVQRDRSSTVFNGLLAQDRLFRSLVASLDKAVNIQPGSVTLSGLAHCLHKS